MAVNLVGGWTEPIRATLTNNGLPFSLTSATVEFVFRNAAGVLLSKSGTSHIIDAAAGIVEFRPAAGDLVSDDKLYYVRVKVTINGKVAYFPRANPSLWIIGA